jgi:predicted amidophosphoribosyltransferase
MNKRMARECQTIQVMLALYCREQHVSAEGLCPECKDLEAYALARLERCPFQEGKTTCARCPVHCYQPEQRERIRTVMRYAGPRMLSHAPWLAIWHLWDRRRRTPRRVSKKKSIQTG